MAIQMQAKNGLNRRCIYLLAVVVSFLLGGVMGKAVSVVRNNNKLKKIKRTDEGDGDFRRRLGSVLCGMASFVGEGWMDKMKNE